MHKQPDRLLTLEAMRGVAALIVTFHHFSEGFITQAFSILSGTPAFVLINGEGMVVFFFVLSGVVNCRPLFRDASLRSLFRNLMRRWPRLMMPALLATLFSWALFSFGLYHFQEAAAITGSSWLEKMGNAVAPGFEPSFFDALFQGAIGCFIYGNSNYVSPLWTMHYELMGSLIVMLLAFAVARCPLWTGLALGIAAALAAAVLITPYFLPVFICGALVTFVLNRRGDTSQPVAGWRLAMLLVLVVYFLSYSSPPLGVHAWIVEPSSWLWRDMLRIGIEMMGAVGLVLLCLRWKLLQSLASWRGAKRLGELSLPIFLLHVPIYCSASSWVLVHATPAYGQSAATGLAWLAAVMLIVPASWIFARVDAAA